MDAFASILSGEIAKKKAAAPPSSSSTSTSKYLRRADVEKARQEEYAREQARLESERAERTAKKRKLEEESAAHLQRQIDKRQKLRNEKEAARKAKEEEEEAERRRKERENGGGTPGAENGKTGVEQLDDEAAAAKLRELKEPIRLFGETNAQRLRRIHRLTNPAAYLSSRPPSPPPLSGGELLISPSDVTKDPTYVRRQLLGWFQLLISEWEIALAARPDEVKDTYQGRQATSAMEQAVENLQPLFRHLKKGDLADDVFGRIVELVVEAQKRRYVRANDVYLRLSIGNAAWPIGVTMVGIHERSAREKLHEKGKAAHIMSDEATRKYLQSIKRCLNFAQTRWPPEDPMQIMG